MQIQQLDKDLDFALNKEGRFFSHEEKMAALHRAQIELFYFYYGNPASYQPGRPVPRVAAQMTQAVSSALQPFMVTDAGMAGDFGAFTAPDDMAFPLALKVGGTNAEVKIIDSDKWAKRLTSTILPPTLDYPIAKISADGWIVRPIEVTSITLDYLALPVKPVYATVIVDGEEVFDLINSIDIVWSEVQYNELLSRALVHLGLNVKDGVVMQTAERNKISGN